MNARETFEEIYEEYADPIFRHIYYRLGDRERALELSQTVFTNLWKYLASGKTVEYPQAFLYRSAKHAFLNEIRVDRKAASLEVMAETGFDPAYSGEDAEELSEQREAVERLKELPEAYREVLLLRYVEGMRVRDIAKALGIRENTVSVRIARGIEKLKELYGQP